MHRKRLPIFFHKVSDLLRLSFLKHKLSKPIIPKLLLLKKLRKRKEFKLLRHYNYGFLEEYQFSPSSTPLIHYHRNQFKNRGNQDLCSFFYLCWCLGNLRAQGGGNGTGECQLEALPMPANIEIEDHGIIAEDLFGSGDEGESVDEKAERFIERFYQQMRTQRQESM